MDFKKTSPFSPRAKAETRNRSDCNGYRLSAKGEKMSPNSHPTDWGV